MQPLANEMPVPNARPCRLGCVLPVGHNATSITWSVRGGALSLTVPLEPFIGLAFLGGGFQAEAVVRPHASLALLAAVLTRFQQAP